MSLMYPLNQSESGKIKKLTADSCSDLLVLFLIGPAGERLTFFLLPPLLVP